MDSVNEAALLALMERTGYPMLQVSLLATCSRMSLSILAEVIKQISGYLRLLKMLCCYGSCLPASATSGRGYDLTASFVFVFV